MKDIKIDKHLVREPFSANNPFGKYSVQNGKNFSQRMKKEVSNAEQFEEQTGLSNMPKNMENPTSNDSLEKSLSEERKTPKNEHEKGEDEGPDLGEYYMAFMREAMEKWYSKPRDGYHVTDVCLCPRQKVFREIDRRPIDAKTVSIYAAGKSIHEAIQWLFLSNKRMFEREKYVEYQDIQGSVDIYDRKRNIPLEFKSSRSRQMTEPKSFHVEQLKYYMSILDAHQGYMLYQNLLDFGETPYRAFRIIMNAKERKYQLNKLVKEINSLKRAMEAGNPSIARSVEKDSSLNWLCKDCPYMTDCKKIQHAAAGAA